MTIHLSDLPESARSLLRDQTIELPSWAFGNSGTRFKVFPSPGTPRNAYEKIDDAAQVHRFTGITPRVSLHIPWDVVDDFSDLAEHARSQGITLGTINSNVFQDDDYKFGSLCNPDESIRAKAIRAHLDCIDVMDATGSDSLKVWLADGINYPGQDDLRARQERLDDSLAQIYAALGSNQQMVLEYKFFEPAFYHTDVPDWGTSLVHCLALGERAKVVLDPGHHAPGTNIEFIVARQPDHVLVTSMVGNNDLARQTLQTQLDQNPAWKAIDAIREGRISYLPQQYFLFNAGPYYDDALAYLAATVHPEVFGAPVEP